MYKNRYTKVVKTATVVILIAIQGTVSAGRLDSSMGSSEPAQGVHKRPAAKAQEQTQGRIVHDNAREGSVRGNSNDAQLADYLEMHGRVVEGSIRSTMMPWSALQQVAN